MNIYEYGSFHKFDEKDPDKNFLYDFIKSDFETFYFKANEVKPYLRSTHYLEKSKMSNMSTPKVINKILKI